MNALRDYLRLRAAGVSPKTSAECAGLDVITMLRNVAAGAIIVVLSLYLISERANAVEPDARKVIAEQRAYIAALEQTLAKCLGDKEQAIKIGDEWFLCGATSIGKY